MSYLIGEDMHHGPPGPLDVRPALGADCAMCRKVPFGAADDALQGDPVKALVMAGAVIGVFLYLGHRVSRKR